MKKSICVFCGSKDGKDPEFVKLADGLGRQIAKSGIRLIYGGASVGLMGKLADAAMEEGGEVIGVIPEGLFKMEVGHGGLTELIQLKTMHARKEKMYQLSDGFIALPGGFGTLDELFEVLTWNQLGIFKKPAVLLNSTGYFDHLIQFIDTAHSQGLLTDETRGLIKSAHSVEEAISSIS